MDFKHKSNTVKLCMASMLMALGWLLPFLTMQNPELGNTLCLMHIPVLLAGFVLGPYYGGLVGCLTPITRSILFGRPIFYPAAVCMSVELATYGLLGGLLYQVFIKKVHRVYAIYGALIGAMIGGRIMWGLSRAFCGVVSQSEFTMEMFLTAGFISAVPGIIIQLILIPILLLTIFRSEEHA